MTARNPFKVECVEWAGEQKNGYGFSTRRGRKAYAHRLAYEAECGPVGRGRHVHHLCGNKLCVNVDHLVSATPKEHQGFFHSRRTKTHCIRGHERIPENLYGFTCKLCARIRAKDPAVREDSRRRSKEWYERKRAEHLELYGPTPPRPKAKFCKRGHERTPENLDSGGHCRLCRNDRLDDPERRAAKAAYDKEYRERNGERLRAFDRQRSGRKRKSA